VVTLPPSLSGGYATSLLIVWERGIAIPFRDHLERCSVGVYRPNLAATRFGSSTVLVYSHPAVLHHDPAVLR